MSDDKKLIKSSKRVRDLGEVFTPDFLVERMLDQFPVDAWGAKKNWLEPTCGNGQFILGIIRRKLSYGHGLLPALDTTFGTDIMPDNIGECHVRIYKEIVLPYATAKKITGARWKEFQCKVVCLVENNIRPTKDTLKEDFSKWRRFIDRPQLEQEKMKLAIQSVFELLDEKSDSEPTTATGKRLFRELAALQKETKKK
jgi:hypothetical protein